MPASPPGVADPAPGMPPPTAPVNAAGAGDEDQLKPIKFVAITDAFDAPHSGGPKKLAVVGGLAELGGWSLGGSLTLEQVRREGKRKGDRAGDGDHRHCEGACPFDAASARPGRRRPTHPPPHIGRGGGCLGDRGTSGAGRASGRPGWTTSRVEGALSRKKKKKKTHGVPPPPPRAPLDPSTLFFYLSAFPSPTGDDLVWESATVMIPASK